MNISEFAALVAKKESKKKQVDISQIKEILRVINDITDKEFYKLVRKTNK